MIREQTRLQSRSAAPFYWTMAMVVLLRGCIFCAGLLSVHLARPGVVPQYNAEHPWLGFDARAYRELARHGYAADRQGTPYLGGSSFTLIAYFPVVPVVSRVCSSVVPLDMVMVAGSNLCSLIGFGFLYAWVRQFAGTRASVIGVLITATFPGAVFFTAGMTEGPFFMLVAMALWLMGNDRFYWAAVLAGIATATRPTGVALAMIVPLSAWVHQGSMPWPRRLRSFIVLGAISFSGIIGYEAFLWQASRRAGKPRRSPLVAVLPAASSESSGLESGNCNCNSVRNARWIGQSAWHSADLFSPAAGDPPDDQSARARAAHQLCPPLRVWRASLICVDCAVALALTP